MNPKRRGISCLLVARGTPCLGLVETPNTNALAARFVELGSTSAEVVRSFRGINARAEAFRLESEAHESRH